MRSVDGKGTLLFCPTAHTILLLPIHHLGGLSEGTNTTVEGGGAVP